jgi:hypothetical protein
MNNTGRPRGHERKNGSAWFESEFPAWVREKVLKLQSEYVLTRKLEKLNEASFKFKERDSRDRLLKCAHPTFPQCPCPCFQLVKLMESPGHHHAEHLQRKRCHLFAIEFARVHD